MDKLFLKTCKRTGVRTDAVRLGASLTHDRSGRLLDAAVDLTEGGDARLTLSRLEQTDPRVVAGVKRAFDVTTASADSIARYLLGVAMGMGMQLPLAA